MRLVSILLASAIFTCGSVLSTAVEDTQFSVRSADAVKNVDDKRLLRTTDRRNDYDAIDEDRGINLGQLMKLDDEMAAIKQLATEFADLNQRHKEALNVFKLLKKKMSVEQATYVANLYGKYLENPRLYH
ncbi:hypothetical protein V7S43_000770 [Phytophthora oleae]|uniref:RxLR effector protein n=1 Tax=Phytophthora oleae TaxID=2107226 RepID=A0ABD3GAL1_9STRA